MQRRISRHHRRAIGTIAIITLLSFVAMARTTPVQTSIPPRRNGKFQTVPPKPNATVPAATPTAPPTPAPAIGVIPVARMEPRICIRNFHHEIALMGGFGLNGNNDVDRSLYQHEPLNSPVFKLGYQIELFTRHPVNLLAGLEFIYLHTEDVATGAASSATFASNLFDGGPTLGVGWAPQGAGYPFELQAKFGLGFLISRDSHLQSGGISTSVTNTRTRSNLAATWPGVAAWVELLASYRFHNGFRLNGGYLDIESTSGVILGGAYVF